MPDYSSFNLDQGSFQPTYAGSPLDTVLQTNQALQERHYRNIADASSIELALKQMQSSALPGARDYIADQVGQIHEQLQSMAKSGAENSTAKILALRNAFLGDEGLIRSQAIAKQYGEAQKTIQDIAQKTGREAVYHKHELDNIAKASPYIKDEEGNQVLNPLYSKPFTPKISPYLDPTIDYKRITDEIKPDKWVAEGLTETGKIRFQNAKYKMDNGEMDIPKFLEEASASGITPQKIKALKERLFTAYKNTSAYEQQKEFFGKDDEAQREDLFNYGLIGTYHQLDKHYHQLSGTGGGGGGADTPSLRPVLSPAVKKEAIRANLPWDFELPKAGEYSDPEEAKGKAIASMLGFKPDGAKQATPQEKQAANKNYEDLLQSAAEAYGLPEAEVSKLKSNRTEGKKVIEKFFDEFYQPILSNAQATAVVDNKMLPFYDNLLKRSPQNLNYYDMNGKKYNMLDNNGKVNSDWAKLTGGDPDKFQYGNTLSPINVDAGLIKEDDAASTLHSVTGKDKDGNATTFYMSNPAEIDNARKNTNVVYNKAISKPGVFIPVKGGGEARILVGKQKEKAARYLLQTATTHPEQANTILSYINGPLMEYKNGDQLEVVTPQGLGQFLHENNISLSYKD